MCNLTCPCGKNDYAMCCEPFHLGQKTAQNAEELMRSRYSAFAKHNIDYLVQTTALGQQPHLDVPAIRQWSLQNKWQKLEVIQHVAQVNKHHALVEFKAYYHDGIKDQEHHESSYFVFYQNQWYFLDPTLTFMPSMKHPCICGSGKKYKHCCASFL